ncbi:MAG: undecaprenyl-phosphate glucose phosphotransferase [Candidatus Aminicenantes bacterium]|nr:undecaprenyl-phosphate glucose phosphotransferase [Candidatus Aminicenantes bacterium]
MITQKRIRLIGLFLVGDVLGVLAAYFYSYAFRFYAYIIPVDPAKGIPPLSDYILVFPLFLGLHLFIFYLQGFYRSRLKRTKFDDFILISLNAGITILLVQAVLNYLYAYSTGTSPLFRISFKLSHGFLAVYFASVILLISFLRNQIYFLLKRRYARGLNLQNVIIVGAGEMGRTVAQKIIQYKDLGYVLKGFLDDEVPAGETVDIDGVGVRVLGPLESLAAVLEAGDIQEVYVALDLGNYAQILETLKVVHKHTVRVRLIPDLFQLLTLKSNIQDLDGIPVISIDEVSLRGGKLAVKRAIDLVVSGVLLLLLSPLFLVVSLLVKLTSRGSVFYKQERVGLDGRAFDLIKFRTMVSDAEKNSGPVMCQPGDKRMTRVGRFLRRYSIDEFPQLVNVLRGQMSLIGPRPERPFFVRDFREKIPKYMLRHKVKSGITGWAQVHGLRQDTSIEKRLEFDFYYMQNWSLALDLKIAWMTLRKGFIDRSVK